MPKEQTIIDFEIIWKKINHTTTETEEITLNRWLDENPEHQQFMDKVIRYYRDGSGFSDNNAEAERAWRTLRKELLKTNKPNFRRIISFAAAAVVTIFMIVTFLIPVKKIEVKPIASNEAVLIKPGSNKATLVLDDGSVYDLASSKSLKLSEGGSEIKSEGAKLQYTGKGETNAVIKYNTLTIPRGGEFFLQLADGTKVWLNSETVLRYPVQFAGNERKVELTGEAFFEVSRNEKMPFLVESGAQVIKVLGTEFNISSYTENPLIYTTLVKGSVEIFIKNNPEIRQKLVPNEQSAVNKTDSHIFKRKVEPYQYIAWKDGRFVFEDQNLGEIMQTLSKWYNVHIVFARAELKDIRFTGNLPRYADFSEVLKKIQKTNEVAFIIENKQITIK